MKNRKDSEAEEMRDYIVVNGYNDDEMKVSKIKFSFRFILVTIIYEIGYLIFLNKLW